MTLCYTCKVNPAGTPGWYQHSAYCAICQPAPGLNQRKPVGYSASRWRQILDTCRMELQAGIDAIKSRSAVLTLATAETRSVPGFNATGIAA